MNDVIILKLINGDEMICQLVGENDNYVDVDRPRLMTIQPTKDGQGQFGLIPFLLSNPDARNLPIAKSAIVTRLSASADMSKAYMSTVSGLVL